MTEDLATRRHRLHLEQRIKTRMLGRLHAADGSNQGRPSEEAQRQIVAEAAKAWSDAGLDPNAIDAPRLADEPAPATPEPAGPGLGEGGARPGPPPAGTIEQQITEAEQRGDFAAVGRLNAQLLGRIHAEQQGVA